MIAVLALALVAFVGIVFSVVQRTTSAVVSQVGPASGLVNPLLPMRPGRMAGPLGQLAGGGSAIRVVAPIGGGAFNGLGLLLALLAGGVIGALIVSLVGPARRASGSVTPGPAAAAGAPGQNDAQYQQFLEWQKLEQWHRQMHATAVTEEPALPVQPQSEMPIGEPTPPGEPTLPDEPTPTDEPTGA